MSIYVDAVYEEAASGRPHADTPAATSSAERGGSQASIEVPVTAASISPIGMSGCVAASWPAKGQGSAAPHTRFAVRQLAQV
jgi:hypothetical protein